MLRILILWELLQCNLLWISAQAVNFLEKYFIHLCI